MKKTLLSALAMAVLSTGPVVAAEKTLEFQLVTKNLDPRRDEVPNVEGQALIQSKAFGVALFKDGRIGTKEYVFTVDSGKAGGSGFGYSTYYFDDGSLVVHFTFTSGAKGMHGDYKILSGTGAYAGASGTGTFDSAPTSLKNAGLLKVRLQVTTP